ncbi:MAG: SDR family oxidoreductase [Chloroflexi bacterium]|nr:SDR family oxidoreductase [Chloroflexota bacterium]
MDLGLQGKVAIVGASSRGLGKASALALAQEGAQVVICARNREPLEQAKEEISRLTSSPVHSVVMDMSRHGDIDILVKETVDRFGGVDIVVNNAGGPPGGRPLDMTEEQWNHAIEQNFLSAVRLSTGAIPYMQHKRWGRIINILSVSVKQPLENLVLSNSVRMAVVGFAKTLADEVGRYNITVNNVLPGSILTDRIRSLNQALAEREGKSPEDVLEDRARAIPMRRIGQPEELASLVAFLASERASYISGASIQVDGGALRAMS